MSYQECKKAENMKYEEETKSIDVDIEPIQITELADEDMKAIIGTPFYAQKLE